MAERNSFFNGEDELAIVSLATTDRSSFFDGESDLTIDPLTTLDTPYYQYQSGSPGVPGADGADGSGLFTSATTAPSDPVAGDRWFDSVNGILYIQIDSNWVDISTAGTSPAASESIVVKTSTVNPTSSDDANAGYYLGNFWINTVTPESFVLVDSTNGSAIWKTQTDNHATTELDGGYF